MRRRIITFLCMSIALLSFAFLSAFNSTQKVFDDADLLTSEQEERLQQVALSSADTAQLDLVIVTTNDTHGKTSQQYAEDFYQQNGFGYENSTKGSGAILLINMEDRDAYIATKGIAIQYLDDATIEYILDDIFEYLPDADYYNSCLAFLQSTSQYAADFIADPANSDRIMLWQTGNYTDYSQYAQDIEEQYGYDIQQNDYGISEDNTQDTEDNIFAYFKNPFVCIVAGIVIAMLFVGIQFFLSRTRMTVAGSTYMDKNQFHVNDVQDIYMGTTTVRKVIKKDSGGRGGGGSFHMGSGGSSFGGGGRKF